MHALVIEDYVVLAMQIADELRDLGFDSTSCATTYAEAVALAKEVCPDLITADCRLGSESGLEAVRVICEANPIPVVYIVGDAADVRPHEPQAIILEKPFSSAALSSAVKLAMGAVPGRKG